MQCDLNTLTVNFHAIKAHDCLFSFGAAGELNDHMTFRFLDDVIARNFDFDDLAKAFEVASELLFL